MDITVDKIIKIIAEFITIIDSDVFPVTEKDFIHVTDKLALCTNYFHDIEFEDNNYPEEPKLNYNEVRIIVSKKFPNYGYYNIPKDIVSKISETEVIVGDAIDDICDLYIDLKGISWRFENTSKMDALWNLQFGYTSHWGWHLRDLQWYLYNLISKRDEN